MGHSRRCKLAPPDRARECTEELEIARRSLAKDFRSIDPAAARVILLEGGPRVLPTYDPKLSRYAERVLTERGVEVRTGSAVTRVEPTAVYVGEERIDTHFMVWAAGVTASPLGERLGAPTDRAGRAIVEPDLSVPGHPDVFVIGDLACFTHQTGQPLPGVAQVAMQQGREAARNIRRTLLGEPRRAFRYRDRGNLATIGRSAAVAEIGGAEFTGVFAWFVWLTVHIFFLIGFRNRMSVFLTWAWSFFTWQRGARLITGEVGPVLAPADAPLGAMGKRTPGAPEL